MQNDLSHVNKQIEKDTADINYARQQAASQRVTANQKSQESGPEAGAYYEHEANRFEQQAMEMEKEIDQLRAEKERIERHIGELETQRSQIEKEHADRLTQIDNEITQLRGSSSML